MTEKKLPCPGEKIAALAEQYGTPFYLYDEAGIRQNAKKLQKAFAWAPSFQEYFAVKATPNPYIMRILQEEGCGADCSSLAELLLAEKIGLKGAQICFTSNDTPMEEFEKALALGAILNLDDITHIACLEKLGPLPQTLSFRYNPGPSRSGGNDIIGKPHEAKYGLTHEQILQAVAMAKEKGVRHFGLHTMVISNELNLDYLLETATMMFDLAVEIAQKTGIKVEFINLGGGIGIPYTPQAEAVDLDAFGAGVKKEYERILVPAGLAPVKICLESGRMMTGPYGFLVSRVLHKKDIYKQYVGMDACMANLMRPALYGAYHHITVVGKEEAVKDHIYDVTGSLCENNDKFAIDRALPEISIGDLLVFHDAGAHGHAMGFNYNGRLRCQELLLKEDGSVQMIRRNETLADYFATLDFGQL